MATEIEVEFTLEDLIAFNEYHFLKSGRKRNVIIRFGLPLAWLAITLPFTKGSLIAIIVVNLFLVCSWVFFYPSMVRDVIGIVLRKRVRKGKGSLMFGKHIYSLLPDCLLQVGDFGESRIKWDHIEKVIRNDDFITIFVGASEGFVIPRRCFATQEAFDTFFREAESLKATFAKS
jgi:hypothetical protein